jgi:hypothetical protein
MVHTNGTGFPPNILLVILNTTKQCDGVAQAESVNAFLIRKGFYFEMGRSERLIGCQNYEFALEEVKNHPKTYPEQTDESLLNEVQIMYDLGWDNPDKYGEIYRASN